MQVTVQYILILTGYSEYSLDISLIEESINEMFDSSINH